MRRGDCFMPKTTLATLRRRAEKARKFPTHTCAASRYLHILADTLATGRVPPMIFEEPKLCAESMFSVLAELWELRAAKKRYLVRVSLKAKISPQAKDRR